MKKRLYRSSQDKQVGGVCGGLAEYLNLDPSLVRIATILLIFVAGTGFLAYLVAWFVVPLDSD
ncbi:PspC domain-containing protein [Desulfosporosinus metallidurans]|uniref:Stress-responsive transcriptional regulator n=1 Tax=Desulfosporosinus metallidurans TaxID=1888891 RepID=A0A1Q8QPW7_9FIRM|nr:PspC domain-containing protein [Desulfosporosinus metallidurans]OLN29385.1 Stress-responsive transcriptional regulator [Desulfosporosinus metallidurans]